MGNQTSSDPSDSYLQIQFFGVLYHNIVPYIHIIKIIIDIEKNKQAAGFALNKLILAYKNKPGFLEKLATYSNPSIVSMFMKGKQLAKDMGFVGVEELQANADNYRERLRDFDKVKITETKIEGAKDGNQLELSLKNH